MLPISVYFFLYYFSSSFHHKNFFFFKWFLFLFWIVSFSYASYVPFSFIASDIRPHAPIDNRMVFFNKKNRAIGCCVLWLRSISVISQSIRDFAMSTLFQKRNDQKLCRMFVVHHYGNSIIKQFCLWPIFFLLHIFFLLIRIDDIGILWCSFVV